MSDTLPLSREMTFTYGVADEVAPGVHRIVANNPGPFTFHGTNTYVIVGESLAVVDPGPDDAAHREAILAFADGRAISHILVTHTHLDHVAGLGALKAATDAKTFAWPQGAAPRGSAESGPTGRSFVDTAFQPDVAIADGARVEGDGWAVTAITTPGHAPDHLAFAVDGTGALLSGDHVMGWNTTVVAPPEGHMGDYLSSLEKLIARDSDTLYLPGHGGTITQPQRVARAYLTHRRVRESAILASVRDGVSSVSDVVARIYPGLDAALHGAAALSVLAHLELLVARGAVNAHPSVTIDAQFHPTGRGAPD